MRDTRSRWGSCASNGRLSFSWRLILAPPEILDYVAAHEVAHLQEMNHSAAFWALCERLCPATEEAKRWLKRNPRFTLHFTPTSSSWLNLVERWFRDLTDKRIRRGSFTSVPELIQAIMDYVNNHNQNPRIFVWSAPVERIMNKIAKCKEALDSLH